MKLGVITPNIFFGESLKSLLENNVFTKDRYVIFKDVTSENIEGLDVIISDYKLTKLKDILLDKKIKKSKLNDIEKILINEKGLDFLPINIVYIKLPFRFSELIEALHSIFERLKSKRENKRVLGDLSFIVPARQLIYRDNHWVELTEKESDIILSLLSSADRGISREEVMSKVWMLNANMETHTFETHLYRLRKKIKENLFLKNLIVNKQGRYYLSNGPMDQKN
tara:strand:+ start:520 stop:1194 length:675 start_codon:yes stop_codon:yes gene_type:complete